MRDPKRIPKILKRLQKLWELNPDMRLGQLIENVFPNRPGMDEKYSRPMYYFEDEKLIGILEKFYKVEKVFGYKGEELLKKFLEEAEQGNRKKR